MGGPSTRDLLGPRATGLVSTGHIDLGVGALLGNKGMILASGSLRGQGGGKMALPPPTHSRVQSGLGGGQYLLEGPETPLSPGLRGDTGWKNL